MNAPHPPLKVSGFTLVRNGVQFEYPFLESMRSLLPLVDELVINVGVGEDETLKKVQKFAEEEGAGKVKFFESVWPLNDPEKKKSGLILAEQTNLALEACAHDWCFYLQADEVLHEDDYGHIRESLTQAQANPKIEAVVLRYRHFYSSYNVIQQTRSAYRREMRIVRRSSGARSVGDAQSFRKPSGEKLKALLSKAHVYHYGWVRTPDAMKEKTRFMDELYHGESQAQASVPHTGENYRYKRFWGLKTYQGTHPNVMQERIQEKGWVWDLAASPFVFSASDIKKVVLDGYESLTGHRPFEYRNYQVVDHE